MVKNGKKSGIISVVEIQEYITNRRQKNYSEKSLSNYENALDRFVLFLMNEMESVVLSAVDWPMIQRYRLQLVNDEYSEHSISLYMRTVKQFYNWLEDENLIFENPTSKLVLPMVRKECCDVLSEDEITKLLNTPDTSPSIGLSDRAMIEILYSCGVRRSELLNLKLNDLDCKAQTVKVFGKGAKERIIPLGKNTTRWAKRYLNEARPELLTDPLDAIDSLWLDRFGKTLNSSMPSVILKTHVRRANITRPVSPHTIRRTCATHMLRNGAHPMMIARMLGHATLKTLSQYLKISITDLMETHAKSKPGS